MGGNAPPLDDLDNGASTPLHSWFMPSYMQTYGHVWAAIFSGHSYIEYPLYNYFRFHSFVTAFETL